MVTAEVIAVLAANQIVEEPDEDHGWAKESGWRNRVASEEGRAP